MKVETSVFENTAQTQSDLSSRSDGCAAGCFSSCAASQLPHESGSRPRQDGPDAQVAPGAYPPEAIFRLKVGVRTEKCASGTSAREKRGASRASRFSRHAFVEERSANLSARECTACPKTNSPHGTYFFSYTSLSTTQSTFKNVSLSRELSSSSFSLACCGDQGLENRRGASGLGHGAPKRSHACPNCRTASPRAAFELKMRHRQLLGRQHSRPHGFTAPALVTVQPEA